MKETEEPRKKARECLWAALHASTTADATKWLEQAEKWIRIARGTESRHRRPSGQMDQDRGADREPHAFTDTQR